MQFPHLYKTDEIPPEISFKVFRSTLKCCDMLSWIALHRPVTFSWYREMCCTPGLVRRFGLKVCISGLRRPRSTCNRLDGSQMPVAAKGLEPTRPNISLEPTRSNNVLGHAIHPYTQKWTLQVVLWKLNHTILLRVFLFSQIYKFLLYIIRLISVKATICPSMRARLV